MASEDGKFPLKCVYSGCEYAFLPTHRSPLLVRFGRWGSYRRSSDGKRVARFICLKCRRSFSQAAFGQEAFCYRQKRRDIHPEVRSLLASSVSQRRSAILLKVSRTTIARKLLVLSRIAQFRHAKFISNFVRDSGAISSFQVDEMETFERSKCLPLSIPIVIHPGTRKILGLRVCSMPAKGRLAEKSLKKYGKRVDERPKAFKALLKELSPHCHASLQVKSDQNPKYPAWLKAVFPQSMHKTVKGRRGCVVGQGELKSGGFDPLFSLNHSCAMIRANVCRLVRRTWCTTKKKERLWDHLMIYVEVHNAALT